MDTIKGLLCMFLHPQNILFNILFFSLNKKNTNNNKIKRNQIVCISNLTDVTVIVYDIPPSSEFNGTVIICTSLSPCTNPNLWNTTLAGIYCIGDDSCYLTNQNLWKLILQNLFFIIIFSDSSCKT